MSTLRRQEPAGQGLKRIACTQVESAIRCLTRQPGDGLEAAKRILGIKAALGLIEHDLPRPAVRRERGVIARLSKGLAQMNQSVLLLARLESRYRKSPGDKALADAVKALRKLWSSGGGAAMSSKAGNFNPIIYRLVADMAELRGNAGNWPVERLADDQPPRGLRRTYTRARKLAGQPVTREGLAQLASVLALLEAQLSLLNKTCPAMIKPQRKLLSRAVGELELIAADDALDAALRKELGKDASASVPRAEPITKRAAPALQDIAHALAESPSAFANRIKAYWSVWRADAGASD